MPPAPLPCPCPCSPPPPQGRWPVCAERGTCAPSLLHFPTSPLPPALSSSPFLSLLRPFGTPFSRVPRHATLLSTPPLIHHPLFFFSFPSSLRPFESPFSRVPRRATFPSAPLRQVLTGNREKSRQPHRRSSRTKKSDPLGPDTIGYQSVFQKKGDYISRIRMLSPNIIKAVRTH